MIRFDSKFLRSSFSTMEFTKKYLAERFKLLLGFKFLFIDSCDSLMRITAFYSLAHCWNYFSLFSACISSPLL